MGLQIWPIELYFIITSKLTFSEEKINYIKYKIQSTKYKRYKCKVTKEQNIYSKILY